MSAIVFSEGMPVLVLLAITLHRHSHPRQAMQERNSLGDGSRLSSLFYRGLSLRIWL